MKTKFWEVKKFSLMDWSLQCRVWHWGNSLYQMKSRELCKEWLYQMRLEVHLKESSFSLNDQKCLSSQQYEQAGKKKKVWYFIWIDFKPLITCSSEAILNWIWLFPTPNPWNSSSMTLIDCPWNLVSLQYPQFSLARCSTDLSIIAHPLVCFEHGSSTFLWIDFCTSTEKANAQQDPPCWQKFCGY